MRNLFTLCLVVAVFFTASIAIPKNSTVQDFSKDINVSYASLNKSTKTQVECLTQNVYFEANSEPYKGQLAVAIVTLSRVNSEEYPNSVCEVVRQKTASTCQFSWWCEKNKMHKAMYYKYSEQEKIAYNEVRKVALYAYLNQNAIKDPTNGALFYHATYVNPKWKYTKTVIIGNHIFYKGQS